MIKQAPVSFFIVWLIGAVVTIAVVRRQLRGQLDDLRKTIADRDNVITFLEKKVEIHQKLSEAPAPVQLPASTAPAPPEAKLIPPVLDLLHFDFEDVAKDETGFYFRASQGFVCKAAILDIALSPISGAVPWTEVQPQIRFKDSNDHVTRVSNAIWLAHDKSKLPLRYGVTGNLVLATRLPKRDFRTYERDPHAVRPLERQLSGDVIRAEIRLIGEYKDDPSADKSFYLEIIKGDPPKILESSREQFDKSLAAKP